MLSSRSLSAFVLISLLAGCGAPANRANTYEQQGRQTAAGGIYKIGTPYQIMGSWYYPRENTNYDEVGIASWYGTKFHGRRTANGEIFDMNLLTAAHPTLPMPVRARVTNLENGKSIIVRINDRGPFAKDREIDLSRKAAEVLGFRDKGTTRVRVQYLGRAPMYDSAGRLIRGQEPASFIAEKPRTPDENKRVAAAPVEQVEKQTLDGRTIADAPPPIASKRYAVQVGVFSSRFNAERLKRQLDRITPAEVSEAEINGETYYRVKVGGANVREDARQTRDMLVSAGHQDAVIVEQ
ncbi:MAG: septal ring lytic transglycosylase RlpA family protein [Pseudomonadota bacterium]|nr:septal ring lytic transglycosylase RlpA family protein [Pseudomonadota bacterium]